MSQSVTTTSSSAQRRKLWLLIFNCQGYGFSNCLELLCPEIKVQFYTVESYQQHSQSIISNLGNYDRILIAPDIERQIAINLDNYDNVYRIPPLVFYGYHVDLCYLLSNGQILNSPLGGFNSAIAYAAFRNGLNEQQALSLYRDEIFDTLGYYDYWDYEKSRVIKLYNDYNFDISMLFIKWSRTGQFMYTSNHPKIFCLHDIAKLVLNKAKIKFYDIDILPQDNLVNGPIFPVYPEIGIRLGVNGNHLFKLGGISEWIFLEEYIYRCFKIYRDNAGMKPHPLHINKINNAISVVEANS